MPVTTIDPDTALIVIDLQKGIVAIPLAHPAETVIARSRTLLDAFRARGLPVVLVNVTGASPGRTEENRQLGHLPDGWAELIPELGQQPGDHLVTKQTRGAFTNTGLEDYLKRRGVTQVVIAGIATSSGVESTARQAYECGFHVTLATDAMTDRDLAAHEHSLTRIFPRLGETGTSAEIVALLPVNPAHPGPSGQP
jgi:nicotinamidase-related amidase